MYQLARDDFFPLVLDSLLFDTNHQLFVLALSVLVTVLPFALQVLITRVPLLMVVLGRAISWRDRPFIDAGRPAMSGATFTPLPNPSHNWVIATSTTHQKDPHSSGDMTASSPIEKRIVQLLLIALYGAWPSNVLAFTRDAPRYLDLKDVEPVYAIPWDDVWEQDQLAGKLLPLIADFQLHPSIITHTSLGELQDLKRWEKYDPSEFVSMCHLLSHSTEDDMFDFFKVPQVQLDPQPAVTAVDAETGVAATDDIGRLKEENELLRLEALYTERLRKQLVYRELSISPLRLTLRHWSTAPQLAALQQRRGRDPHFCQPSQRAGQVNFDPHRRAVPATYRGVTGPTKAREMAKGAAR